VLHYTPAFFAFPAPSAQSGLTADLASALGVYHQANGPKFAVQSSKLGLHVIPTLTHDQNGVLIPSKNLLDVFITVPTAARTPYAHFEALCAALALATGVKVMPWIPFTEGWQFEFGADPTTFSWGANSETGREAIIDLLDRSATSMTWRLFCRAGPDTLHNHECTFFVDAVPVSITGGTFVPSQQASEDSVTKRFLGA
jgi:hypothetical protein